MEDNRFKAASEVKNKNLPHHLKQLNDDEYFSEELLGLHPSESQHFAGIAQETFRLFEQATDKIISEKGLSYLNIPPFFHSVIEKTWKNREENPFLYGRFDINGGLDGKEAKTIEFNADTCTSLPETIHWQDIQLKELGGNSTQFNSLFDDLKTCLTKIKSRFSFDDPFIVASSFGHKEDIINCNIVLDAGRDAGFNCYYCDLEQLTFSEDGIFYDVGGEYQPVDVWFKLIPWDWIFNEEPNLAKELIHIIEKKQCVILNPPYTAIWQNKKFLAYITQHFPNRVIAETYTDKSYLRGEYVQKPIYGRMGENIRVVSNMENETSGGDYETQEKVYQAYYPLLKDGENYYYQLGFFYTTQPSAINFRAQPSKIITDDCEFMSHYIITY
ncbi:glutathionylspermidine synthase [Marivirga lumbricoides]|uniref:Glutathionylspermidine synthase n=1 Tax=Marivirga lumbricoides TaxID=1046115 RepID=A0ABQ1LLZ4_9BACT|nr:glutathionylspermidine synthase [Marivirga lumbricoides]